MLNGNHNYKLNNVLVIPAVQIRILIGTTVVRIASVIYLSVSIYASLQLATTNCRRKISVYETNLLHGFIRHLIPAFQHRNAAEGAVGIAGLYIGRLRNCLPFLTSFTQCRMANLHIKCFDINAYQRLECYRALK